MQSMRNLINARRGYMAMTLRAVAVVGYGLLVCGCQTDQQASNIPGVPDTPFDYRQRHPITVTEGEHTLQIFVGSNRDSLTPSERAEVAAFGRDWRDEATGGVLIDLPKGTVNARSAKGMLAEIQSILGAMGVPPRSVLVRTYQAGARSFATIRVTYPKIVAQAGPCGMWPKDIGPNLNGEYFENKQYWNFGCSMQHNLAVMVENPEDLVQPRSETPAYTMRRTQVVEKYREGQATASTYTNTNAGKISDLGQ